MNNINCKKIFSWLPIKAGYDKVCHFVAGIGITSLATTIGYLLISINGGALLGLGVGVGTAIGKEVFDKYRENGSGFDFFDMFATILGVLVGLVLTLEIIKYI